MLMGLTSNFILHSQEITGVQLLEKSIGYHDPGDSWPTFSDTFYVTMESPENSPRYSEINIDLPNEYFYLKARRDSSETTYQINKGECLTSLTVPTSSKRTPCETARLYKDYYTYLYGLPMKLKDPGTYLDPVVRRKKFNEKEYLVLKVTYDKNVGSDVWFFYFDPHTYAMEVYQFFKGDPESEGKNTGEYILLEGEELIQGIRIPKIRRWFYNKNNKFLGSDILQKQKQ